jgi:phospholipase C
MNSMILFKNDLSVPLEFTADVEPKLDSGYWGLVESSAAADQNKSLFWVSRSAGITDGVDFMFTAKSQVGGIAVTLSVQLTGTLVGSDMRIAVQAGDQRSEWSSGKSVSLDFLATDGKFYHVSGAYVGEGAQFENVQFSVNPTILPQIKHVVVLMFENRSFDNLLGWLYDGGDDVPGCYIPDGTPETFNGLTEGTYANSDPAVCDGKPVPASKGTTSWPVKDKTVADTYVPNPDPGEEFSHCRTQIGENMDGFLTDYLLSIDKAGGPSNSSAQIMQSYAREQIPIITTLARWFAVSDAWHASVPSQTWPNRAFAQAGASAGHVNNESWPWNIPTIFDVLEQQGLSWRVYNNSALPSLTKTMFFEKYSSNENNFGGIGDFQQRCKSGDLPVFTFLEPSFGPYEPDESYHPPYDVTPAEAFLAKIYNMLRESPSHDQTLFIVLFDEHGGTYDHVTPPPAPQPFPPATDGSGFKFDRFGVRVPAIVISSYTTSRTVFRSETDVPYDHTSVLATLRDWLGLHDAFRTSLASPRIATAPTLAHVLNLSQPRAWPPLEVVPAHATLAAKPVPGDEVPLNDNQRAIVMALSAQVAKRPLSVPEKHAAGQRLQNHGDARTWLAALAPHLPASQSKTAESK